MGTKERQAALNHRLKASRNDEADGESSWRCECADLRCNATFELTNEEIHRRRSHPDGFWVKPGHEVASVEHVVEQFDRFTIVQLEETPLSVASDDGEEDR